MTTNKKKNSKGPGRGGARPGSGRKPHPNGAGVEFLVSLNRPTIELLKEQLGPVATDKDVIDRARTACYEAIDDLRRQADGTPDDEHCLAEYYAHKKEEEKGKETPLTDV